MADIKISALPTATTPLTGAELVPIVQGGVTKRTTTSDVLAVPVTSLTASSAVATDASKKLVSVTNTGTGDNVLATSPTLVTPILGTPQSATLTNATGLPLTTGVTGLLPVANGGTGTTTPALVAGSNISITGSWPNQTINSSAPGTGTVTSVSVVSANGLAGTVANATTTPAITLSTSVTGVVKGNGTTLSAATAGTDYVAPGGALGTPSSGTVTNLTGTASININGTVGATTPADGTFTSLTDSGNLTFTGTGNRITGDFSNATVASRVMFQTSTANSSTVVGVVPSGTGTASQLALYSTSDAINSSAIELTMFGGVDARLNSKITGTGTYLPMTFYTGGSERVRVDASGNVGIGTASPSGKLDVDVALGVLYTNFSTTAGGSASIFSLLGGTASEQAICYNSTALRFGSVTGKNAAGFSEKMRITSGGDVTVMSAALLGYGTGSGGTVTQATSKSTAVTLNKPTGQISVNNSALGANVSAVFTFNNTLISASDVLLISRRSNGIALDSYSIDTMCGSGVAYVAIRNITSGSLSESLELSFAVIKGATS